jgi:hypothetical protein
MTWHRKNGPYHVVKYSHNDVFTTYAVYVNNRVYLKPPKGRKLGRWAARKICQILNDMPPRLWVEHPMSREELLARG